MSDFDITKTMNMLHDYLCWLYMKRFVNVTCGSSTAFSQIEFSLHTHRMFLMPSKQWSYACLEILLVLTRPKEGKNLICILLNEIWLLALCVIAMKCILYSGKFVLRGYERLQGVHIDENVRLTMTSWIYFDVETRELLHLQTTRARYV